MCVYHRVYAGKFCNDLLCAPALSDIGLAEMSEKYDIVRAVFLRIIYRALQQLIQVSVLAEAVYVLSFFILIINRSRARKRFGSCRTHESYFLIARFYDLIRVKQRFACLFIVEVRADISAVELVRSYLKLFQAVVKVVVA